MTVKTKKFVESYVSTGNATQAAIDAGFSPKTAYSSGNRLLKKVEVQAALKEISEQISSEKICNAEEVQIILTAIARGEVSEEVIINGKDELKCAKKQVSAMTRIKAIDLLCRMNGWYKDKTEVTFNQQTPIIIRDDVRE
jgi:phage terminase small subunit